MTPAQRARREEFHRLRGHDQPFDGCPECAAYERARLAGSRALRAARAGAARAGKGRPRA